LLGVLDAGRERPAAATSGGTNGHGTNQRRRPWRRRLPQNNDGENDEGTTNIDRKLSFI
jgi:hypothetical protein